MLEGEVELRIDQVGDVHFGCPEGACPFLATLLTTDSARTTPPFLASFVDGRGQFLAVLSAAATIAVLPVIVAGWVAQKQLVRGLAMGAVK